MKGAAMRFDPHRLLIRLLIAVILLTFCMSLYHIFYCHFSYMC